MKPYTFFANDTAFRRVNWAAAAFYLTFFPLLALLAPEWKQSSAFFSWPEFFSSIFIGAIFATPFAVVGLACRSQVNPLSKTSLAGIGLSCWLFTAGAYKFYEIYFEKQPPDNFDGFLCYAAPIALLNSLYLVARALAAHWSRT